MVLRTTVPRAFFQGRLTGRWEHHAIQQDVGCIQNGPLTIDVPATWAEHERFHASWDARLATEVAAIQQARPHLILSNTSYLALAAGTKAGVRTAAVASLTWDEVLDLYRVPGDPIQQELLNNIRQAYAQTNHALRIAPGLPMTAFRQIQDIGPIASPSPSHREQLRTALGLTPQERLVLVAFGGISLRDLPWEQMNAMPSVRFIVDSPVDSRYARIVSLTDVPLRFSIVLASVDLVMTKPGYGTVVECVTNQIPLVYVRRYNFADEAALVGYIHRYGRGVELTLNDFQNGTWQHAFEHALALPLPDASPPAPTGGEEAARRLAPLFV